jgi:ribosomal protein S27AE
MHRVCYKCGDSGVDAHWGDDCPMQYRNAPSSAELNLNMTWSAKHANRFICGKEKKADVAPTAVEPDVEPPPVDTQNNNWYVTSAALTSLMNPTNAYDSRRQVALLDSILDDRWD